MGAKFSGGFELSLALAAALAASSCASLKRFAPPGFVKYEDRAGDIPVSPAIKERIETRRESEKPRFPDLTKEPAKAPKQAAAAQTEAERKALLEAGAALEAEISNDRTAAGADRARGAVLPGDPGAGERPLDQTRDALSAAVEQSSEAARLERAEPLPGMDPPQDDSDGGE